MSLEARLTSFLESPSPKLSEVAEGSDPSDGSDDPLVQLHNQLLLMPKIKPTKIATEVAAQVAKDFGLFDSAMDADELEDQENCSVQISPKSPFSPLVFAPSAGEAAVPATLDYFADSVSPGISSSAAASSEGAVCDGDVAVDSMSLSGEHPEKEVAREASPFDLDDVSLNHLGLSRLLDRHLQEVSGDDLSAGQSSSEEVLLRQVDSPVDQEMVESEVPEFPNLAEDYSVDVRSNSAQSDEVKSASQIDRGLDQVACISPRSDQVPGSFSDSHLLESVHDPLNLGVCSSDDIHESEQELEEAEFDAQAVEAAIYREVNGSVGQEAQSSEELAVKPNSEFDFDALASPMNEAFEGNCKDPVDEYEAISELSEQDEDPLAERSEEESDKVEDYVDDKKQNNYSARSASPVAEAAAGQATSEDPQEEEAPPASNRPSFPASPEASSPLFAGPSCGFDRQSLTARLSSRFAPPTVRGPAVSAAPSEALAPASFASIGRYHPLRNPLRPKSPPQKEEEVPPVASLKQEANKAIVNPASSGALEDLYDLLSEAGVSEENFKASSAQESLSEAGDAESAHIRDADAAVTGSDNQKASDEDDPQVSNCADVVEVAVVAACYKAWVHDDEERELSGGQTLELLDENPPIAQLVHESPEQGTVSELDSAPFKDNSVREEELQAFRSCVAENFGPSENEVAVEFERADLDDGEYYTELALEAIEAASSSGEARSPAAHSSVAEVASDDEPERIGEKSSVDNQLSQMSKSEVLDDCETYEHEAELPINGEICETQADVAACDASHETSHSPIVTSHRRDQPTSSPGYAADDESAHCLSVDKDELGSSCDSLGHVLEQRQERPVEELQASASFLISEDAVFYDLSEEDDYKSPLSTHYEEAVVDRTSEVIENVQAHPTGSLVEPVKDAEVHVQEVKELEQRSQQVAKADPIEIKKFLAESERRLPRLPPPPVASHKGVVIKYGENL